MRMTTETVSASYVVMGSGSKGSNFGKIATQKRADALVEKGLLAGTPHGNEITTAGRDVLAQMTE